ncbi:MAG TPA: MFS transporter [Phycisphaerae bacterium]|nr:MFS transporter [Phycisphaerae bacterium]
MTVLTRFLPPVEPRLRGLFLAMLGGFVLFGLNLAVIGAVVPKIIRQFGWSYTATGVVFCAGSVGYLISTLLCGVLIGRVGPKAVIVGGLAVQAVGLSLFAITPSVALNVLLQFVIGAGSAGTEVVINYAVVRLERSGQSRLMNLTHAAFAVGAILSPVVLESLIAAGATWQAMFRLMAVAAVAMGVAMALAPFRRLHDDGDGPRHDDPSIGWLVRQPLLLLCFGILLVYVGAEIGVSSWVGEYYVSVLKTPKHVGSIMVSVFWVGLLAGRLGVSVVYHGTRLAELMVGLSALAAVALLGAALCGVPWAAGVGFFLAGVGYSAIYPLVMSLVGRHYPRRQSVAVGFAGAGGAVGSLVIPLSMAALSDRIGIGPAFYFYVAMTVVMLALALAVIPLLRRRAE